MSNTPSRANRRRIKTATHCLDLFTEATNSTGEDAVTDLMADLGHYCDSKRLDFDNLIERAKTHWREER